MQNGTKLRNKKAVILNVFFSSLYAKFYFFSLVHMAAKIDVFLKKKKKTEPALENINSLGKILSRNQKPKFPSFTMEIKLRNQIFTKYTYRKKWTEK